MTLGKKIALIVAAFFALVILCAIAALIYWNSSALYADEHAKQALQSDSAVQVVENSHGDTTFIGPDAQPQATYGLLFYPGGNVDEKAYAPFLHQLASKGWLCVALKVPLRMALLDTNAAQSAIEQYPQVEHWIVAGHSLGGVASAQYASNTNANINGLVLLAAYSVDDLSVKPYAVLTSLGTNDGVVDRNALNDNAHNLPAQTQHQTIEGGNHSQYGSYGLQPGDNDASISADEQIRLLIDKIDEMRATQKD